jgi:hypothetical protein
MTLSSSPSSAHIMAAYSITTINQQKKNNACSKNIVYLDTYSCGLTQCLWFFFFFFSYLHLKSHQNNERNKGGSTRHIGERRGKEGRRRRRCKRGGLDRVSVTIRVVMLAVILWKKKEDRIEDGKAGQIKENKERGHIGEEGVAGKVGWVSRQWRLRWLCWGWFFYDGAARYIIWNIGPLTVPLGMLCKGFFGLIYFFMSSDYRDLYTSLILSGFYGFWLLDSSCDFTFNSHFFDVFLKFRLGIQGNDFFVNLSFMGSDYWAIYASLILSGFWLRLEFGFELLLGWLGIASLC